MSFHVFSDHKLFLETFHYVSRATPETCTFTLSCLRCIISLFDLFRGKLVPNSCQVCTCALHEGPFWLTLLSLLPRTHALVLPIRVKAIAPVLLVIFEPIGACVSHAAFRRHTLMVHLASVSSVLTPLGNCTRLHCPLFLGPEHPTGVPVGRRRWISPTSELLSIERRRCIRPIIHKILADQRPVIVIELTGSWSLAPIDESLIVVPQGILISGGDLRKQ